LDKVDADIKIHVFFNNRRREGGKEGRREGGKEGRREGGKEGRRNGEMKRGSEVSEVSEMR
jgi:hypothetical protein